MKEDGLEENASDLRTATVHWLRHTGISEDVKIRPREYVCDDADHNSMQTTNRYIESDEHERHAPGKGGHKGTLLISLTYSNTLGFWPAYAAQLNTGQVGSCCYPGGISEERSYVYRD